MTTKKQKEKNHEYQNRYFKKYPWVRTYYLIYSRIKYTYCESHKAYRNIKLELTIKDLKDLWFRDKAHDMKRPSIDRKDHKGNYTLQNCRYIELSENVARRNREVNQPRNEQGKFIKKS